MFVVLCGFVIVVVGFVFGGMMFGSGYVEVCGLFDGS